MSITPTPRFRTALLAAAGAFIIATAGCAGADNSRVEDGAKVAIHPVRAVARVADGTLPNPASPITWQRTLIQPLPNASTPVR
ncbi:MAG: hypothetical protein L0Z55_02015 [Planctomycetes bacterium]|nr:hypothetical protein [Planctomycetota bacterium]